jgi:hypothetical protein
MTRACFLSTSGCRSSAWPSFNDTSRSGDRPETPEARTLLVGGLSGLFPRTTFWPFQSTDLGVFVGTAGFEPATSCSQSRRAAKLRYVPVSGWAWASYRWCSNDWSRGRVRGDLLVVDSVRHEWWVGSTLGFECRLGSEAVGRRALHTCGVLIRIEGVDLPGAACGPSPEEPGGYHRIHVGMQRKNRPDELLGLARADQREVSWTVEASVAATSAGLDITGPYVSGRPGGRFIYLSWVTLDDANNASMFRRAKLWLDELPEELVHRAVEEGVLVGRLGLTDSKGNPVCASLRPPGIEWSSSAT